MEARVDLEVMLGKTFLTLRHLKNLKVGSHITLDKFAGEPLDVKANGEIVAQGEAVEIDENLGVRITDVLDEK
ncbi:MAG: FliM/FliN family flagellar motor switch protein [Treponema sp.]|nr:FliM/FliN family flagellar motor switch protein [Candidatus Treponema equifaecale]